MAAVSPVLLPLRPITPLPYGLHSLTTVNNDETRWQGGIQLETDCSIVGSYEFCDSATSKDVGEEPSFAEEFEPFAVYSIQQCKGPGAIEDAKDRAVRILTSTAWWGVEDRFLTQLENDADRVLANDFSGITANSPETELAVLEEAAGQVFKHGYNLIFPRGLGSYLANERILRDTPGKVGTLSTRIGSPAAVLAHPGERGLPDEQVQDDGVQWGWAVGNIVAYSGQKRTHSTIGKNGGGAYDNSVRGMAEQPWIIGHDGCGAVAMPFNVGA